MDTEPKNNPDAPPEIDVDVDVERPNPVAPETRPQHDPFSSHSQASYHSPAARVEDYACLPRYDMRMPPRCIHCNAPPSGKQLRKNTYRHHPAWYTLLLLSCISSIAGPLVYVIVALIVREKITIEFSLCARHRILRIVGVAGLIGGVGVGIAILYFAQIIANETNADQPDLAACCVIPFSVAIVSMFNIHTVTLKRLDDKYAYFSVGDPFLKSLPLPPSYWNK